MISSPSVDHNPPQVTRTVASTGTAASFGGGMNPLWLLVAAGALFFAFAAALLASG